MKITIGEGLKNSIGSTLDIPDLLHFLERDTGMGEERWLSLHAFVGGHRKTENWLGAYGVPVDLDFRATGEDGRAQKVSSDAWAEELERAWDRHDLAGTLFWRTPHGIRIIYELADVVTDQDVFGKLADAAGIAAAKVVRTIVGVDVEIDAGMRQVARLLYFPRTKVKGDKRMGKVLGHRDEDTGARQVFSPAQILALIPKEEPVPPPPARIESPATIEGVTELAAARQAFIEKVGPERLGIPGLGSDFATENRWCPVCHHEECFGPARNGNSLVKGRWVCYSDNHWRDTQHADKGARCGVKTRSGTATGDTLDLACFFAGIGQAQYLTNLGFLKPSELPMPPSAPGQAQIKIPRDGITDYQSTVEFVRQALEAAPAGSLYRWGGQVCVLSRVDGRITMRPLAPVGMALLASRWADYFTDKVTRGIVDHPRVNLDTTHGAMLLEAAQLDPKVRELRGVIEYPAVGPDGQILKGGWNEASGMWFEAPQELEGLEPAVGMSRDEARAWMRTLLEDFVEVLDEEALANAVGLIVTAFVRPALVWHPVPMHAAVSSMEGSGKSILCETFVGEAVTGRPSANMHLFDDPDELAKSLFAYAQSGANCVVIDNVKGGHTVDDGGLASAITRPTFAARVLGQSQVREMANLFVPMLTGNNVSFSREMSRRIVPIQFRPTRTLQERTFKHDARAWVKQNRRRLAEVVLGAVARASEHNKQGFPGRCYNGFEQWSRLVGGVVWQLGQDAWLKSLRDFHASETSNPELAAMRGFCQAWHARADLRSKACRAADLWCLVEDDPSALGLNGATDQRRRQSLGWKLTEMIDRVDLHPYRISYAGTQSGTKHYSLTCTRQPGEEG